ncbi:MAG: hypothetical protein U0802_01445 [Candidatus Binatia bacterium]
MDGRAVMEQVRRERDRFVGFVIEGVEAIPAAERIRERPRPLPGARGARRRRPPRIEARAVVIATGSRPTMPPSLLGVREQVLDNDAVFELRDLPRSLARGHTGVIGLEIGQAMHRSACARCSSRTASGSRALHRSGGAGQRRGGARRRADAAPVGQLAVRRDGGEAFVIEWRDAAGSHREQVDAVLAAAGRIPISTTCNWRRRACRWTRWAAGGRPAHDAVGDGAGLPRRRRERRSPVAARGRRRGADRRRQRRRLSRRRAAAAAEPLMIAFTDPNMAVVGTPWAGSITRRSRSAASTTAIRAGRESWVATPGWCASTPRRACGTLLGAEMFGPRVEHTAHLLAWAVQSRMTVEQALAMPFYHPVVEEGSHRAARARRASSTAAAATAPHDLECGPNT